MIRLVRRPSRAMTLFAFATAMVALGTGIQGCASVPPVDRPCGVIIDPLKDVHATTAIGDERISAHFERGVHAGCWSRK